MTQNQKVPSGTLLKVKPGDGFRVKEFLRFLTRTLKTEQPAHRDTRPECAFCMSLLEIRAGNIRTRYRNGYGMKTGTEKRRKEGVREWHRHRDS